MPNSDPQDQTFLTHPHTHDLLLQTVERLEEEKSSLEDDLFQAENNLPKDSLKINTVVRVIALFSASHYFCCLLLSSAYVLRQPILQTI